MPLPLQARVIPYRAQVLLVWEEIMALLRDTTQLYLVDSGTLLQVTTLVFLVEMTTLLQVMHHLFLVDISALLQESGHLFLVDMGTLLKDPPHMFLVENTTLLRVPPLLYLVDATRLLLLIIKVSLQFKLASAVCSQVCRIQQNDVLLRSLFVVGIIIIAALI